MDSATGKYLVASDRESHVIAVEGVLNTDQRHLYKNEKTEMLSSFPKSQSWIPDIAPQGHFASQSLLGTSEGRLEQSFRLSFLRQVKALWSVIPVYGTAA